MNYKSTPILTYLKKQKKIFSPTPKATHCNLFCFLQSADIHAKRPFFMERVVGRKKPFTYSVSKFDVVQWCITIVDQLKLDGDHFWRENRYGSGEFVANAQTIATDSVQQLIRLGRHVHSQHNLEMKQKQ
jgi:hypothetical protein